MTAFRAIPLSVHGVLEVLAAPLLFVAPFALGFTAAAGAISIAIGALLLGLALSLYSEGDRGSLPLSAHAGFDYILAATLILTGIVVGIATHDKTATIFMVGFGSAHLALTTSTRFTRPLGA
jgi:multisubunit Na+/H+ antiporter MnhC subunit